MRPDAAMRSASLVLAVVLAMSCTPKVCDDTQPLPRGYEEMAALLPKAAVVCKDGPNPKAVFLNFASRDVKQLTLETMLQCVTTPLGSRMT